MADQIQLDILVGINESLKSIEKLQSQAQNSFESISTSARKSFQKQEEAAKRSNDLIGKSFGALKVAAAAAIAVFSTRAIVGFFEDAVKAAGEEQEAIQRLNTALQLNGIFSEKTSQSLQDYADAIEKTTKFSGEAVLGTTAFIAGLTNLDENGLKKATSAAVELASRLRIDLDSASKIVVKATQGNTAALGRYGIKVEEAATKTGTYANFLKVIEKFQGSAAREANTFGGALTQLGNAYEDVLKAVGSAIVGNKELAALYQVITRAVSAFAGGLRDGNGPISQFVSAIAELTVDILPSFIFTLNVANEVAGTLAVGLNTIALGFVTLGRVAIEVVNGVLSDFTTIRIPDDFLNLDKIQSQLVDASAGIIQFKENVSDSLTNAEIAAKKGQKEFKKLASSINQVGENSKNVGPKLVDDTEDATAATKDLNTAYNKFKTTFESVSSEVEKQGKTKQELADLEFKNSSKLAADAAIELANQGKLTDEIAKQIALFQDLGKAKRDASIKSANEGDAAAAQAEQDKQNAATFEAIKSGFSTGVDLIKSGISQAFALGSAILDGQVFTELKNALESTILAPIQALSSLRDLSKTFSTAVFGEKKTVKDTEAETAAKDAIQAQLDAIKLKREEIDLATSLNDEQKRAAKAQLDLEIKRLTAQKNAVNIEKTEVIAPSLTQVFKDLIAELPKFVTEFVKSFPELVNTFLKNFPKFVDELAKAIPVVIDQLVKAFPAVVNTLADAFDKIIQKLVDSAPAVTEAVAKALPRIFASLLDGLTKIIDGAPAVFQKIFENLPALVTSIFSRLPNIITSLTKAIPQIVRSFAANLPTIVIAIIEELPEIVQALVESFITLVPDIIIALVDELITKGGLARIVVALVEAMPLIAKAFVIGIVNGGRSLLTNLFASVGAAFTDTFKNNFKFPKIEAPKFPALTLNQDAKDILTGKKFADKIKEPFNDFIEKLKKALTLGVGGGGKGGILGTGIRLAKGGMVPKPIYAATGAFVPRGTDTVPAMLTPGELVIPRKDVDRLSAFLDTVEARNSSQSSVNLEQILSRMDRTSQKEVTVNIQVGEKQLSQVLLNLNRQGFRTA